MSETQTVNGTDLERAVQARRLQYAAEEYRRALDRRAANHTTVAERKAALAIRDDFERRLRDGSLDVARVAEYAAMSAYTNQGEARQEPSSTDAATLDYAPDDLERCCAGALVRRVTETDHYVLNHQSSGPVKKRIWYECAACGRRLRGPA